MPQSDVFIDLQTPRTEDHGGFTQAINAWFVGPT